MRIHDDIFEAILRRDISSVKVIVKLSATINHGSSSPARPVKYGRVDDLDERGATPLHCAARNDSRDIAAFLIAHGGALSATDLSGKTPLHYAAEQGSTEVARVLIAQGASINAEDLRRRTPLHYAAERGHLKMIRLLLSKGAPVDMKDSKGLSIFDLATQNGQKRVAYFLRNKYPTLPYTHILDAIGSGDLVAVKRFMKIRGWGKGRNLHDRYPLHYAAQTGSRDIVSYLLEGPGILDAQDPMGMTPLHYAALRGSREIAELMIAHKQDLNATDVSGMTPLHHAVKQGNINVIDLLLAEGADLTIRARDSLTPLDMASRKGEDAIVSLISRYRSKRHIGFMVMGLPSIKPLVMDVPAGITCRALTDIIHRSLRDASMLPPGLRAESLRPYSLRNPLAGFARDENLDALIRKSNPFHASIKPADYDELIHIGRYFAFCRAGDEADRGFISYLGFRRSPGILPRFGIDRWESSTIDLRIEGFCKSPPRFQPIAALSCDKLVYRQGEKVSLFVLCMASAGIGDGTASVSLHTSGREVPGTERGIQLHTGLGLACWESLPQGMYTARFTWRETVAECTFTVGEFSRSAAHAEWVDGPRRDNDEWVGAAGVFLYGMPLPRGIDIMIDFGRDLPPIHCTTDDESLVHIRIPVIDGAGTVIKLSWHKGSLHTAELTLPGGESYEGDWGMRVMSAAHEGSVAAAGVHVSGTGDCSSPLRLYSVTKKRATLVAVNDIEVAAVTGIFPGQKPASQVRRKLRKGDSLSIKMPAQSAYGFLCIGALSGVEISEALVPIIKPQELEMRCHVPPVIQAGSKTRLKIELSCKKETPVAIIIRDIRLHAGGGLGTAGASRRIENLCEEKNEIEGTEPAPFSESYLDALFGLKDPWRNVDKILTGLKIAGAIVAIPLAIPFFLISIPFAIFGNMGNHHSGRGSATTGGTILVDLLPTERKKFGFPMMPAFCMDNLSGLFSGHGGLEAARGTSRRILKASGPEERIEVGEPADTIVAEILLVNEGKGEIDIAIPPSPATYGIEVLAIDRECLGWLSWSGAIHARRAVEIHTDSLPACVHADDEGHVKGTVGIISLDETMEFEAERDGKPLPCTFRDGSPVSRRMGSTEGRAQEIIIPVSPGTYHFTARRNGEVFRKEVTIRPAQRISERVRRLVVLRQHESLELRASDHIFQLHVVNDPDEVFRNCGHALASYAHLCCEQTAAAMLGALLAYAAGDSEMRIEAIKSLRKGIERLERMWKPDGFAMYLEFPSSNEWLGMQAYMHIAEIHPLQRILCGDGPRHSDLSEILGRIAQLECRASRVYGPVLGSSITSLRDAYLSMEYDRSSSLGYVLKNWKVLENDRGPYGLALKGGTGVSSRAETCYAATVLTCDERQRNERFPELVGTLNWLGSSMKTGGRLYSTLDSAALMPLLAGARAYGLFGEGYISLDNGPAMTYPDAREVMQRAMPRTITCLKGQLQLLIDMVSEREIPDASLSDSLRVDFLQEGMKVSEAPLGSRLDLVIKAGPYEPGLMAHVVLPPCLALEEGGARTQVFQRDFQGRESLRIPCGTVGDTGGHSWKGMVVLQNMYDEDKLSATGISFRVNA
jgi:ankyrin repeat protein